VDATSFDCSDSDMLKRVGPPCRSVGDFVSRSAGDLVLYSHCSSS